MRIGFVIYSLEAGGAERVAATMVNWLAKAGEKVTLVTLESTEKDFYELDSRVARESLNLAAQSQNWPTFIANNWRRVRTVRSYLRVSKFDVVLSFVEKTNILTLLASRGLEVPIIVTEHIDPRKHSVGVVTSVLRRMLYPSAKAVVVLTRSVAKWAEAVVRKEAIFVIPNPIAEEFSWVRAQGGDTVRRTVLAMGRMLPQKGFDRLLIAFAWCAKRHSEWQLKIVGDGADKRYLQETANRLGIANRISLEATTKNPERAFCESDMFVLSSRYEGFPMVLLEAMACGLPVISFDCPSGPREIIRDGIDGVLVPPDNVEALGKAMDRLMGDPEERRRLAVGALEVNARFGLPRVMAMWSNVLAKSVGVDSPNCHVGTVYADGRRQKEQTAQREKLRREG